MTDVAPEVLARLVRRSRVLAVALGLAGFGYAVLVPFVFDDWPRGEQSAVLDTALFLVVFVAPLLALPAVHSAVFRRACRRPRPGFALGRYDEQPAFAAPLTPRIAGPLVVVLFEVAGAVVPIGATPVADAVVQIVLAVLLVASALVVSLSPPPLRLTTDGVVVTGLRTRLVPWDAFAPGGPAGPETRPDALWLQARAGSQGLGRSWPTDVRGRPPAPGQAWYRLRLGAVLVDPEFLARSVRTYRSNPRLRPAIGTDEGVHDLFGFAVGTSPS
ncbi:hypothetical protein [Cryptosporangium sp. NPDC051539]|uniref:hypothetical protein n=1 Tax=Cryptosporangium sp. NPDC051539 TaxID=3363962 RepID=UPI0037B4B164